MRRALCVAAIGCAFLAGAVALFARARLYTPVPTVKNAPRAPVPALLEKSLEKSGMCELGSFIHASSCRRDARGEGCCTGLRQSFQERCSCSALPNIVANNGGKGIYFLFNYVRCQYTDERDIAPVDLVSEAHPCMDQRAWCNRRLPSVDIRLEAFDVGRLQIADELGEWAHVTVDESELSTTADVVCRTLGFLRVRDARLDSRTRVHRRLACGEVAAASGKISDCTVSALDAGCPEGGCAGALRLECEGGDMPALCSRVDQSSTERNALVCMGGLNSGHAVAGHTRRVGATHAVCGTAGINESRIEWYDGFADDFDAYDVERGADGALGALSAVGLVAPIYGQELVAPTEREAREEQARQAARAAIAQRFAGAGLVSQRMARHGIDPQLLWERIGPYLNLDPSESVVSNLNLER